jgi:hypothetical protein
LYARGAGGRLITRSGAYYVAFALPFSSGAPRTFGLHLADGSEILTRRVSGPSVRVFVGARGAEIYGSCLGRLQPASFARGWLPILETAYRDRDGVRYQQESFVGRIEHVHGLASFVHIALNPERLTRAGTLRLAWAGGSSRTWRSTPGRRLDVYAAWIHDRSQLVPVSRALYEATRAATISYWDNALDRGTTFRVPEKRVMDAERALLVQEVEMTWRYSIGNQYEELSFAEALDVAQVLAAYGFADIARQICRFTLLKLPDEFSNWRAGERLVAGAVYFQLQRNSAYVREETPGLTRVLDTLERALDSSLSGLLPREQYSKDIDVDIYSLHGQTLVWQGLLAMSRVWRQTGYVALADRAQALAERLGRSLRRAVDVSARTLPDGSYFVPTRLLEGGRPFDPITSSREGTYWNLVAPYALASGFFTPGSTQARGFLRYLRLHGGLLLGVVRAGGRRLSPIGSGYVAGVDQVYGINVSRFLADNDQPDELVLGLYGTLAAAMTRNTYVTGEAASVQPVGGALYRSMHLPPNNDGNAAFLETLRLMLVHEDRDAQGAPRGVDLAFATPRRWLGAGKTIAISNAPTSFGPVSYTLRRDGNHVRVLVEPPPVHPAALRLRIRLPRGERVQKASGDGRSFAVDAQGTIDLTGVTHRVVLDVRIS